MESWMCFTWEEVSEKFPKAREIQNQNKTTVWIDSNGVIRLDSQKTNESRSKEGKGFRIFDGFCFALSF